MVRLSIIVVLGLAVVVAGPLATLACLECHEHASDAAVVYIDHDGVEVDSHEHADETNIHESHEESRLVHSHNDSNSPDTVFAPHDRKQFKITLLSDVADGFVHADQSDLVYIKTLALTSPQLPSLSFIINRHVSVATTVLLI